MAFAFGPLKIELSEHLTIVDCRKLCTYFEILPAATEVILSSTPQGLALLEELQQNGAIGPRNLHRLHDAFKHLRLDALVQKVENYQRSQMITQHSSSSDDSDSDENEVVTEISFEEFKLKVGLTKIQTMKKSMEVKRLGENATPAEVFWEKITSLDYRITSLNITQDLSVRDLIFAILHCSDNPLRQDIATKMSLCQLAVPLVINSVSKSDKKPVFLYWAMRAIRKKWKATNDNDPIERPIHNYGIFTVSFLRIKDVRVSKSDLLNSLLSQCGGNQPHTFFLTKKEDLIKPVFSVGSIEIVWYTPEACGEGFLSETTAFLNLRGCSQQLKLQTKFLCEVSNLMFILVSKKNRKEYRQTIDDITRMAAKVVVLSIRETDDKTQKRALGVENENVIFVRKLHIKVLNEEICERIKDSQKSCPKLWSLENYKDYVQDIVEMDMPTPRLSIITDMVENIVPSHVEPRQFKTRCILRLFDFWLEWVKVDEMTYTTDSATEQEHASRDEEKISLRKQQIETNISHQVQVFWDLLGLVHDKNDLFDDCLNYLKTVLFELTRSHQGISNLAQTLLHLRLSRRDSDAQENTQPAQFDYLETYFKETQTLWEMNIGIEDFIRELGQLFEATVECGDDEINTPKVAQLPVLAAQFVANGNSLEILDDKSYCMPVCWISRILQELAELLGENAKVLVISVIGVQGSGKSTLLNTMFGTKFPVSAGRCTRGIFLHLLKVEESFAETTECNYIIVVDTEGLNADHGGLNDADSRRLDNKMVTLAMCIADLIIVNIEGENIACDMTNFLQIAAYALIRMKEVDLQSQCRIIQQRVSDPTACAKNRTNMLKILSNLDTAVKDVAKAEGDHFESFSDIFQLRVEDHTQYVCNLWSGSMSPPNPLYGRAVTKFKGQIFDSISTGELKVHFTFKTFCERLLAVHEALKEENFVLNFEDVSRAISYNELSLQCNKWLGDARIKVMDSWQIWKEQIKTCESTDREQICETIRHQLSSEIQERDKIIQSHYSKYKEENDKVKHVPVDYVETWINSNLLTIKIDMLTKIQNEVKASKWAATDIPSFVDKMTKRVRLQSIKNAIARRDSDSTRLDTESVDELFNTLWDQKIREIVQTFQETIVRPEDIGEKCTSILIFLCKETAFYRDIALLLREEGVISNHYGDFNMADYIPKKIFFQDKIIGAFEQFRGKYEQNNRQRQSLAEKVKRSTLKQFDTDCRNKAFDSYLIQITLQKTLENLTLTEEAETIKIPSPLLAKVLLHVCSRISDVAAKNHRKHQTENSVEYLFDKKKNEVNADFRSFYCFQFQDDRACEYICNLLERQFHLFTLRRLRSNVVRFFIERVVRAKFRMHFLVLKDMFEENRAFNYIEYIHDNVNFLKRWMRGVMSHKLCRNVEGSTLIKAIYKETLNEFSARPITAACPCAEALTNAMSMKTWFEFFNKLCMRHLQVQFNLEEAHIYQISNFAKFSQKILDFCRLVLFEKAEQHMHLPIPDDINSCEIFLEQTLNCPYDDVINNFVGCQERCPFCRAPCCEESTERHKHTTFCHFPRGLSGKTWVATNRLVEDFCTSSVSSPNVCFEIDDDFSLYKDYAKYYPDWKIQSFNDMEHYYWQWVFSQHNDFFSNYYMCAPATIPEKWHSSTTRYLAERSFTEMLHPLISMNRILWRKFRKHYWD